MQQVTLLLVTIVTTMIGIYALNTLVLMFISLHGRNKVEKPPQIVDWPIVSIHLPLYNEKKVASRAIFEALLGRKSPFYRTPKLGLIDKV